MREHLLAEGKTLYAVSRAYGVSVSTLMTVNRITDPTSIPAGTPIFVPGATERLPIGGAGAGGSHGRSRGRSPRDSAR